VKRSALLFAAMFLVLISGIASAQDSNLSANFTGVFSSQASGNGLFQSPTKPAGLLLSYRHFFDRNSGIEANYGYTRGSQNFLDSFGTIAGVQSNVHEITGAYVFRAGHGPIRPFALAGGGLLVFDPTSNNDQSVVASSTQAKAAFLYGGGVDFKLTREVAFRAQYRGLVYKAPDFGNATLDTGAVMHTAEPSIGLVVRF